MTRWLEAAKQAYPPSDKTDKTDKTPSGAPEAACLFPALKNDRPAPEPVLSVLSVLSVADKAPPLGDQQGSGRYPYGLALNGFPKTWTGKPVSPADWQRLSTWERHGSTDKVWNGLTGAWEAEGGAP